MEFFKFWVGIAELFREKKTIRNNSILGKSWLRGRSREG